MRIRNFPLVKDLPPPIPMRELDGWIEQTRADLPGISISKEGTARKPDGSIEQRYIVIHQGKRHEILGRVMLDGMGSLAVLIPDPKGEGALIPDTHGEKPMTQDGWEALVFGATGSVRAVVPVPTEDKPRRGERR